MTAVPPEYERNFAHFLLGRQLAVEDALLVVLNETASDRPFSYEHLRAMRQANADVLAFEDDEAQAAVLAGYTSTLAKLGL